MSAVLDQGLGKERTCLAWRRTALSLLAGAAVIARLFLPQLGSWAVLALGAALAVCLGLVLTSTSGRTASGVAGGFMLVTALVTASLSAIVLAVIILP